MNSIKLAIITTLLGLSVASVQADTATPNILSSVSEHSVQTLSDTEASKIRGQVRECTFFNIFCNEIIIQLDSGRDVSQYNNYYSSRKHVAYGKNDNGVFVVSR